MSPWLEAVVTEPLVALHRRCEVIIFGSLALCRRWVEKGSPSTEAPSPADVHGFTNSARSYYFCCAASAFS
jgi:hypothetical protein